MATENLDPNGGEKFLVTNKTKDRRDAERFANRVLIGIGICLIVLIIDITIDPKYRSAFNWICVGATCIGIVTILYKDMKRSR